MARLESEETKVFKTNNVNLLLLQGILLVIILLFVPDCRQEVIRNTEWENVKVILNESRSGWEDAQESEK